MTKKWGICRFVHLLADATLSLQKWEANLCGKGLAKNGEKVKLMQKALDFVLDCVSCITNTGIHIILSKVLIILSFSLHLPASPLSPLYLCLFSLSHSLVSLQQTHKTSTTSSPR